MERRITIHLFGEFSLIQDGTPLTGLDSPRLQVLLAYLALRHPTPQPRQRLAFLLWPEADEKQARTNLRNLLHRLRQAWPQAETWLDLPGQSLSWLPGAAVHLDVAEFESALRRCLAAREPAEALNWAQEAVDFYRGELLPGFYDEWILAERARLEQAFSQALERQVECLVQLGQVKQAIQAIRRLVQADPLGEATTLRLMNLHLADGDRAAALSAYHRLAQTLQRELQIEPNETLQAAYQDLLAGETAAAPLPAMPAGTVLVGRQAEWEYLIQAWRQVASGRRPPLALLVRGEAGVGKSTLANALLAWLRKQGETTASAACYAPESDLALAPVADWLRALPHQDYPLAWRSELARLLPEHTQDQRSPQPGRNTGASVEPWQKGRFFEIIARAVLAHKQPICLLLEDIQWSDPETLAWLHYLLRLDARAKLLVLMTLRPGESEAENRILSMLAAWREQRRLEEMDLARLSPAGTEALAASLVGAGLPVELSTALYRHTDGNPLFVVEILRSLVEQAAQKEQPCSPLQAISSLASETHLTLPPRLQVVITSRLDQLSEETRRLLGVASVIGRTFNIRLLLQTENASEEDVVQVLDELWRKRILIDRDQDTYEFSHEQIRQVVYAGLSPARRRWLHGRVAQTLEQTPNQPIQNLAGRLAFHFEAAGQAQKAYHYHHQAAAEAQSRYAYQEAIFHLQAGLLLVERAALDEDPSAILYEQIGDIYNLNGSHAQARQAYQQAYSMLTPHQEAQRPLLALKMAHSWLSQYDLTQAWQGFEQALDWSGGPDQPKARHWQTWLDARLGQLDVLYYQDHVEEMAALAELIRPAIMKGGSPRQRSGYYQARVQLGSRQTRFRHTPEIVADSRTALQLAQEAGDETLVHSTRFSLGFALLWAGETVLASTELSATAESSQASGNIPLLDRCLAYLSVAYRLQGLDHALAELLPRSLGVAEQEQNPIYLGIARANQAWLACQDELFAQAAALSHSALASWGTLRFPFRWLARWPLLAACLELGEVETAVGQAHDLLSPDQQPPGNNLAELLQAAIQAYPAAWPQSRANLRAALDLARQQRYL